MIRYLLAGTAALLVATAAGAENYAVQAGHLIVDAAQAERGPSTVIIENGRVSRIENGFTTPAGAIVVDERSRTVMPGMTDVHVHLTQTAGTPWYAGYTIKYSDPYATTLGLTHARPNSSVPQFEIKPTRWALGATGSCASHTRTGRLLTGKIGAALVIPSPRAGAHRRCGTKTVQDRRYKDLEWRSIFTRKTCPPK